VVAAATMDTYLQHSLAPAQHAELKIQVGNLLSLLKTINDKEMDIARNGNDPLNQLTLAGLLTQLNEGKELYLQPDQLSNIDLSCEDDIFFEVLVGNIKNSLISFQAFQKKIDNIKTHTLTVNINRLRDNFAENHQLICDLETELNGIIEANVSKKVTNLKLFEGLHSEKPNSLFLSLAKKRNTGKLSNIKRDNGTNFSNNEERQTFIDAFYSTLYKKQVTDEPPDEYRTFLEMRYVTQNW